MSDSLVRDVMMASFLGGPDSFALLRNTIFPYRISTGERPTVRSQPPQIRHCNAIVCITKWIGEGRNVHIRNLFYITEHSYSACSIMFCFPTVTVIIRRSKNGAIQTQCTVSLFFFIALKTCDENITNSCFILNISYWSVHLCKHTAKVPVKCATLCGNIIVCVISLYVFTTYKLLSYASCCCCC